MGRRNLAQGGAIAEPWVLGPPPLGQPPNGGAGKLTNRTGFAISRGAASGFPASPSGTARMGATPDQGFLRSPLATILRPFRRDLLAGDNLTIESVRSLEMEIEFEIVEPWYLRVDVFLGELLGKVLVVSLQKVDVWSVIEGDVDGVVADANVAVESMEELACEM